MMILPGAVSRKGRIDENGDLKSMYKISLNQLFFTLSESILLINDIVCKI